MLKKKHLHLKTKTTKVFIHVLNKKAIANFEKQHKKENNFESNKRKCSTISLHISLLPSNVILKTTESHHCIRKQHKMKIEIFVS